MTTQTHTQTDRHSRRVVTWQSPSGATMQICRPCEERLTKANQWPRDGNGTELCSVSRGEHAGVCEFDPSNEE